MSFKALTRYLIYKYFFEHEEEEDVFKRILSEEDRRKRDRRIPRMSIRRYGDSPFKFLFESDNDQALLNLTGLDHSTFNELLALFGPQYKGYMFDSHTKMGKIRPTKLSRYGEPRGRRREMDATGCTPSDYIIVLGNTRN